MNWLLTASLMEPSEARRHCLPRYLTVKGASIAKSEILSSFGRQDMGLPGNG